MSERGQLHLALVERVRTMIVEGELAPGARISERELCARFEVSRTPLREALKILASEGMIELLPHRGARISRLTLDDIEEIFPVMGALEALAGELAAARISEDELAELKAMHYQMVLHYRRRELQPYFRLNQAIHELILAAARNPTLTAFYKNLSGRIRRARYLANMSEARWSKAVVEHEAMLAALDARDGASLARILKEHLRNKCETVRESLLVESQAASNTEARSRLQA